VEPFESTGVQAQVPWFKVLGGPGGWGDRVFLCLLIFLTALTKLSGSYFLFRVRAWWWLGFNAGEGDEGFYNPGLSLFGFILPASEKKMRLPL
jgi:hypothetical protein